MKAAQHIPGYVSKHTANRQRKVLVPLHSTVAGPCLECGVQSWTLHSKQDVDKPETAQLRNTEAAERLEHRPPQEELYCTAQR